MSENLTLTLWTMYIIAILLITLALNLMQRKEHKRLEKNLQDLEREKNLIIGAPVLNELLKVEALVKNDKMENRYNQWQQKFEFIKTEALPMISDMLIEADYLMCKKEYNPLKNKIATIEIKIYEVKTKTDLMLAEIKEITSSESKNREIITKLKSTYRELLSTFEKTKLDFSDITKPIELQFENIEKRFQEFEIVMEKNDFDEVNYIVKAIHEMILHMKIVVEEVPTIILMGQGLIPKKIEEISTNYIKMTREGYQLDYLNVEYNIAETEKKLNDIFDRVKVLNLEDAIFELKTILNYFDSLFNDFEKERIAKRDFEDEIINFKKKLSKLQTKVQDFYLQVLEVKGSYDLSEEDLKMLENHKKDLEMIGMEFSNLQNPKRTKETSYSLLKQSLIELMDRTTKNEEVLNELFESIGSMKDDEERAKEQLTDIINLFKKTKLRIREYAVPVVANNYYVELKDAADAIKEVQRELDRKPINISQLNIRVDTARDLVFKFYNTTNDLLRTVSLIENTIVYGNRYRSSKPQVDEGLTVAERLFYKGEYKKALEITINAIDIVEPGIHKKILALVEKK